MVLGSSSGSSILVVVVVVVVGYDGFLVLRVNFVCLVISYAYMYVCVRFVRPKSGVHPSMCV